MVLTFEGCEWVGDFEKKFPASACRKKKIASSTNGINKEFLHCCKKVISSFKELHKTPAKHTKKLLLRISNVLQSTYQEI